MANRIPKVELSNGFTEQPKSQARGVRCKYYAIQNSISDGKDDIGSVDSKKFKEIMKEIETSHNEVKKPREQVADAEALFDLARTLVTSVRSHNTDGITPYMFISSLLRVYGSRSAKRHSQNANTLRWKKIGHAVSPIFGNARGCHTMIGPMDRKVKQRKYTRRPRSQLYLRARPKQLDFNAEEITDTDKNIATMFQILKKEKRVKLENLVLNRKCFAQTIENLFALSFLVKDGRVVIHVDENRSHFLFMQLEGYGFELCNQPLAEMQGKAAYTRPLLFGPFSDSMHSWRLVHRDDCPLFLSNVVPFSAPRNGPAARLVMSGEVKYSHFVFRLDFVDWELMKKAVPEGEELMPNRVIMASPVFTEANKPNKDTSTNPVFTEAYKLVPVEDSRLRLRITRVKKMSRNHGKVLREASDIDNSPEIGDANIGNGTLKRKLL